MSIAGMVVWALTAGIGIYLLAVGLSAQRAGATPRPAAARPARPPVIVDPGEDGDDRESATVVGSAALTMVLGGGAPSAGRQPVEGSPLLEFIHPALALLGLTFWICYVMSGYRVFAWIAFGVVVATVAAGLGWEAFRRRTVRQRAGSQRSNTQRSNTQGAGTPGGSGASFPPRLIMLHGFAAACTFALVIITAAAAGHG